MVSDELERAKKERRAEMKAHLQTREIVQTPDLHRLVSTSRSQDPIGLAELHAPNSSLVTLAGSDEVDRSDGLSSALRRRRVGDLEHLDELVLGS